MPWTQEPVRLLVWHLEAGHFLLKGDRDYLAKHKAKKLFPTRGRTKNFARSLGAAISICDALLGPCWRSSELRARPAEEGRPPTVTEWPQDTTPYTPAGDLV